MGTLQNLESLVGQVASFRKTVAESDVYLFAGLTGDFSPNHVDEQAMSATPFGTRIVHGVLIVGFMSTAATRFVETTGAVAVSAGYDRLRFVAPVRIGQTISVTYTITSADPARHRTTAHVEAHTEDGQLCAVAEHLLAFVDSPDA